jgi:hypothetical protein
MLLISFACRSEAEISMRPLLPSPTCYVVGHLLWRCSNVVTERQHNDVETGRHILAPAFGKGLLLRNEHSELGCDILLEPTKSKSVSVLRRTRFQ